MKYKNYSKKFTLIELLVVISIMVIIAGIGIKGYKRMSGEMALNLSETQVRQVVTSTILEAKRNRIPMQLQVFVPQNNQTQTSIISGGAGSLIAYWDFDGNDQNIGLRRLELENDFDSWGGYFGKGAKFNGNEVKLKKETSLFSFDNNVYMEVMLRPDINTILSKTNHGDELDILNGGDGKFKLVLVNHENFGLKIKAVVKDGANSLNVITENYFPDDGQWHKIGISTLGGKDKLISIYVNNVIISSKTGKVGGEDATLAETFSVGKSYYGIIDDIKVYNIGGGTQVYLNPRDVQVLGQNQGTTRYINISPYGTIKADEIIQIASTRMIGDLIGASPNYTVKRIRSTVPKLGFISFNGQVAEYQWDGDDKLTILEDGLFGTAKPNQQSFQVIKPVVIRKNGTIQ